MGLLKDLTTSLQPLSNTLADTFKGGELIDTGEILESTGLPLTGPDSAESDPTGLDIDLLLMNNQDQSKHSLVEVGVGPSGPGGWSLTDIDVLSGSYGAGGLTALDVGPDLGEVVFASILQDPEHPLNVQLLGNEVLAPLNDLGAMDGLVPLAIVDSLGAGGVTDGLIPSGMGGVLPTDILPLGLLDGLLGDFT